MSNDLDPLCRSYGHTLEETINATGLAAELFNEPDHVGYMSYDGLGFEDFLRQMKSFADELSYVELNDRRIGAAWFMAPIAVKKFGNVHWLEVLEPPAERPARGVTGINHMEFYYPDLDKARYLLDEKDLPYAFQSDRLRSSVSTVIDDLIGLEVRFTDQTFGDMMAEHLHSGEAHVL